LIIWKVSICRFDLTALSVAALPPVRCRDLVLLQPGGDRAARRHDAGHENHPDLRSRPYQLQPQRAEEAQPESPRGRPDRRKRHFKVSIVHKCVD